MGMMTYLLSGLAATDLLQALSTPLALVPLLFLIETTYMALVILYRHLPLAPGAHSVIVTPPAHTYQPGGDPALAEGTGPKAHGIVLRHNPIAAAASVKASSLRALLSPWWGVRG